jgi:hypothetical protein
MRKYAVLAPLAFLLSAGALLAQGNNPLITVFENGNGSILFPGGPPSSLPGVLSADPGPGGLSSALTFNLLGPPALVAGDLRLQELIGETVVLSDIVRFNPAGTGNPAYPASLVFYSDTDDIPLLLADTGFPTAAYTNLVSVLETALPGGGNGFLYTPTANQPGFVPGFSVTYNIVSDSVPEPATASLVLVAAGALFFIRRWRIARSTR